MLYQVNNKAQAIGFADYSVDNFLSVFETPRSMKIVDHPGKIYKWLCTFL